MARKKRIEFPGAFYHIYSRGNNKQRIFLNEQDFTAYIERIGRYQERYKFICYVFMLMPNHIHLVVETKKVPLSKIMQGLQQSYTLYFHKKYKTSGHLFQGRYGAILCEREEYLLTLLRYIHLNPLRSNMVKSPEEYLWSSHRAYLGVTQYSFLDTQFVLSFFSEHKSTAIKEYSHFIGSSLNQTVQLNLNEAVGYPMAGSQEFVEKLKEGIEGKESLNDRSVASIRDVFLSKLSLDEILQIVSKMTTVPPGSLIGSSRDRSITFARSLFAFISVRYAGIQQKRVAKFLSRDASYISRAVLKIGEEHQEGSEAGRRLKKALREISQLTHV